MRLINVDNYEIHEFVGKDIPKYAILSHCWGEDEVLLSDMQYGKAEGKLGFQKIRYTCEQAKNDYLAWAWVDTCCIDKTSSAELSESINSMYQWYAGSRVCYTYLSDISKSHDGNDAPIGTSRWFTRGWTLQELIAPPRIKFYDKDWNLLGHKLVYKRGDRPSFKRDLAGSIADITGIPQAVLRSLQSPFECTVAARMSWASKRLCTRVEDTAYCRMGLFDVHMPLIYGEGKKAFIRLQEEILRESDDQTLLAWTVDKDSPKAWARIGVLAESPANFASSGGIQKFPNDNWEPWSVTSLGMKLFANPRVYEFPHRDDSIISLSRLFAGFQILEILLDCGHDSLGYRVIIKIIRSLDSKRTCYRLAMPYLEYHDQPHDLSSENEILQFLYIAKSTFGIREALFETGGIHLYHLPRVTYEFLNSGFSVDKPKAAAPYSTVTLTNDWALSGTTLARNRWLPENACIQFLRDAHNILFFDPFQLVCVHHNRTGEEFSLYFGSESNNYYIALVEGNVNLKSWDLDWRFQEKSTPWKRTLSPNDERGVVAWDSLQIGQTIVKAILVCEDSQTLQEEMVGTRVHFFVIMEFETYSPREDEEIRDRDMVDVVEDSLSLNSAGLVS